jgi:hypothetical protein
LSAHAAPGRKVRAGCGVISQQLDHCTDADVTDAASYFDDWPWTPHSTAIQ